MKTVGNRPAKTYGINTIGLERKGFSKETIEALQRAYRILDALETAAAGGAATRSRPSSASSPRCATSSSSSARVEAGRSSDDAARRRSSSAPATSGALHARVLTEIPEAQVVGFVEPNDAIAAEVEATLKLKRFESVARAGEGDRVRRRGHADHHALRRRARAARSRRRRDDREADHGHRRGSAAADRARRANTAASSRSATSSATTRPSSRSRSWSARSRYFEAERLGVFVRRSLDIDVLLDLMIHDLNLVLSLLQQKVVEVRAVGVPVAHRQGGHDQRAARARERRGGESHRQPRVAGARRASSASSAATFTSPSTRKSRK